MEDIISPILAKSGTNGESPQLFIEDTSSKAARQRAEDILGVPVVKDEWNKKLKITPAQAKQILLAMPPQRPLTVENVNFFKAHILLGTLPATHQGIAFDTDGLLFDGQHRLQACVETGLPIEIKCCFNEDRANFVHVDKPRVRTIVHDLIASSQTRNSLVTSLISAGARILVSLDKDLVPWTAWSRADFTVNTVSIALQSHPYLVEAAEFCAKNRTNLSMIGPGIACGFLARFMEINKQLALSFYDEIMTGAYVGSGHPAFELRRWLNSRKKKNMAARPALMIALVRTWNAAIEGRSLKNIVIEDGFAKVSTGLGRKTARKGSNQ